MSPSWPSRIMCITSMPAIRLRAQQNVLNPSIGRAIRLMARLVLFHYEPAVGLNAGDGGPVGATLVYRDLLGHAVQVDGSFEECACRGVIALGAQQEVDGVAVLVNRSVQVLNVLRASGVVYTSAPSSSAGSTYPHLFAAVQRAHPIGFNIGNPARQSGARLIMKPYFSISNNWEGASRCFLPTLSFTQLNRGGHWDKPTPEFKP